MNITLKYPEGEEHCDFPIIPEIGSEIIHPNRGAFSVRKVVFDIHLKPNDLTIILEME